MKKLYLLLFLFLFLANAFSQTWAPVGAQWYHNLVLGTVNGYEKTEVMSDTIFNGIPCKRVSQVFKMIDASNPVILTYPRQDFYTYENSGKVYVSTGGPFYLIQDWNAQPGDTVPFLWNNSNFAPSNCDPFGVMFIDSIGTVNINGNNYTQQYVHYYDSIVSLQAYPGVIVEHFGSMYPNFFFTRDVCDSTSIIDVYPFAGLTCYYDSTVGWAYFGQGSPGFACDYLNNVEEEVNAENILVYPNPGSENINIYYPGNASRNKLQLIDVTGKILFEKNYFQNKMEMDVSNYATGYYILKLFTPDRIYTKELLVK